MSAKILQIIPAEGWQAEFVDSYDGSTHRIAEPLCAWALTEDDNGNLRVEGVSVADEVGPTLAEFESNFKRYSRTTTGDE